MSFLIGSIATVFNSLYACPTLFVICNWGGLIAWNSGVVVVADGFICFLCALLLDFQQTFCGDLFPHIMAEKPK